MLGTEYRADYQAAVGFAFGYGRAAMVWISPDPTGRYLLFSYETGYGFYIGWLEQGEFHLLPERQPYLDVPGPWSPAW